MLEVDDVATCMKHLKRKGNEPTNRTVILWDMNRFGIDVEVIEKVARVGSDSARPITRGRHKRDRQVARVGSGSSSTVGESEIFPSIVLCPRSRQPAQNHPTECSHIVTFSVSIRSILKIIRPYFDRARIETNPDRIIPGLRGWWLP